MGRTQQAEELESKIASQIEIKASLQAAHLKEEQEKLPPEIQYVLRVLLIIAERQMQLQHKRLESATSAVVCCLFSMSISKEMALFDSLLDGWPITSLGNRMWLILLSGRS